MPWALIGAACLAMFAATASGTTRAPFLIAIAADLDASLPLVANLFSMTATAWGIASAVAGPLSDRVGRRWVLVLGPIALGGAMAGTAAAGGFFGVAVWATLGGLAAGSFTGVIFAEVSDRVADSHRGRALGWVMSGQSITLLVGVPLAAWAGAYIGWRGWSLCVAALSLASALALFGTAEGRGARATGASVALRTALPPRIVGLLAVGVAERVCYGLAVIYFATFLQTRPWAAARGTGASLGALRGRQSGRYGARRAARGSLP